MSILLIMVGSLLLFTGTLIFYPLAVQSARLAISAAGLWFITGGLIYFWTGGAISLQQHLLQEQTLANARLALRHPYQVINRMREILNKNPDQPRGWFLLGRLYEANENWVQASRSFDNAIVYSNQDNPEYLFHGLLASYRNDRKDSQSLEHYLKPLRRFPEFLPQYAFLAREAETRGDIKCAQKNWQTLKDRLPPGTDEYEAISKEMAKFGLSSLKQ